MQGLLFKLPEKPKEKKKSSKSGSQIKLKKGDTIASLVATAEKLVEEKLGKYKEMSRCVTNVEDLQSFFDETPENAYIALDTETTRLILRLSINKVNQFIIGCARNSANGPELEIVYG